MEIILNKMEIILKLPVTEAEIKAYTTKLWNEITLRNSEIQLLHDAIKHYQKQCKHPGQQTGYNERDGDWANVCSICGYSH
jgi:hypothetical protein